MTMPGTISKLVIKNVMKVKFLIVEPDPDDPIVLVNGENGVGKSTVLNSIKFATAGKNSHPPRIIREGETEACIEYETPEFQVVRDFSRDSPDALATTNVELRVNGEKKKSPQTLLNEFYNDVAMEVESFMALDGPSRRALLAKATGVNTDLLDQEHDKVFAERTETGREMKGAQARFEAVKALEEPPPKSDTSSLVKQQGELNAKLTKLSNAQAERNAADRRVSDCQAHVRAAENAVKQAQEALVKAQERLQTATDARGAADNAVDAAEENAEGVDKRLGEIAAELQHAAELGAQNARWEERCRLKADVDRLQTKHDGQDKRIDELRAQTESIIAAAKFPVPGLGFAGRAGVSFRGLPFEQASQAEQLRCSVGIAVALNPKLRIILIRQGSLFDRKSIKLLRELCREYRMQAWLEVVDHDGPATVTLVDGEARA